MATEIPSQQDLYDLIKNEIQSVNPSLTDFEDGSILDSMAGAVSVAAQEVVTLIITKFNKTFLATAHGPEITGGADDLELLATDHFGDSFARPPASKAVGTANFSRPTTGAGNVTIPAGTIVKTDKNANGEEQRYTTLSEVTMIGLSIDASVEAVLAGGDGNAGSGTVINIESALTDPSIVVTNTLAFAGGDDEDTDAEYREFIRNKVEVIRGATKAAIEAAALNVPGVEIATAIEALKTVIEYNIGGATTIGSAFFIPDVKLYIADVNGTASQALIDLVDTAILTVRACGVKIDTIGATPLPMDWAAAFTLNPGGPNFAEFSTDSTRIVASMKQYIQGLAIGDDFNIGLAKLAIMAIWGPSGTNDLTDFVTSVPIGNISAAADEKLISGTITAGA